MDKSLATYFDQKKFLSSWNDARQGLQKQEEMMSKYIENETKPELQAVEEAMKKYQEKMKLITERKEFTTMREKHISYTQRVDQHISQAITVFEKEKQRILADPKMKQDEKYKMINQIHDYIMSKLFTKEETDAFKKKAPKPVLLMFTG